MVSNFTTVDGENTSKNLAQEQRYIVQPTETVGWTPGVSYIILGEQVPIFKLNTVCLGKAKCSPKPYIEKEPPELLFLLSLPSKCLYINIKCYLPDETFAG